MIYLDHAATAPLRRGVLESMLPYLKEQFANASGVYAPARSVHHAVEQARRQVSSLIGASVREVIFTSGGTESDNWALYGTAMSSSDRKRIVTSAMEHHAVLNTCHALANQGYEIICLQPDKRGYIRISDAEEAINENTCLVSLMLANNELGTLQPVRQVAQIAHARGALMHTDAVQAVGHIPVDVNTMDVDLLSMSAHKFGGPKGVGALYIRSGTRINPLMNGGAQERGMRPGTENTPAIVGMGYAAMRASEEMDSEAEQVRLLRDHMLRLIKTSLPNVRINSCCEDALPGHVHVSVPGMDTSMLLTRLDIEGIAASAGSACASGSIERSHVLSAMYPDETHCADLRFSIGPENTLDELEKTVSLLQRIVNA